MAQVVAHFIGSEEVTGSTPVISSYRKVPMELSLFLYKRFYLDKESCIDGVAVGIGTGKEIRCKDMMLS